MNLGIEDASAAGDSPAGDSVGKRDIASWQPTSPAEAMLSREGQVLIAVDFQDIAAVAGERHFQGAVQCRAESVDGQSRQAVPDMLPRGAPATDGRYFEVPKVIRK